MRPRIPHSRPSLGPPEEEAARRVLSSGQLAADWEVRRFEEEVACWLGLTGGVATSSGTAALHVALLALGVGPGHEVIVPTYVCSAVLHAVQAVGARPVPVDVLPDGNLDPDAARASASPRTRAVVVTHAFGRPADLDAVLRLGVPVVEDIAQSLGARYRGRLVGSFGDVAVCSFYATKLITSGGEGGMVLAKDAGLLRRARSLCTSDARGREQRFNYRMTDLAAAVGRVQLRRLPEFLATRWRLAGAYDRALAGLGLELPPAARPGAEPVAYRYVVRHPEAGRLLLVLRRAGVEAKRPVKQPLHRALGLDGFPVADGLHATAVSLPIYPSLSEQHVHGVAEVVRAALEVPGGVA
ncbi:MAG: DegT/DnrJ/EryC1/StrS family aminotransferase [Armatimonadota bacterium]|nr:DegT/DnrJ/EryC1/StrS family aminotransferase [Armatimonadota bacterium]MDR7529943.1 DegT/DnrJ/EryC1/StrS family aminotransferase [Armatimonadota bacterium]MDR7564909.1 DegT/DnrJ/EryC1/StrS family aminotransferase [Armatimonadota bacterium]MDR7605536.1 DegT/DnrJ/EryC1/StrS family aminotransferase [Armatimonadota bacterium]MDR7608734.1 DegT/DnrJ/EryC1/StrS family aminotransferase [Armatimonadota bacterium]